MVNAWRAHVKKTFDEMKADAAKKGKGVKVLLKHALKRASSTYKKGPKPAAAGHPVTRRKCKGGSKRVKSCKKGGMKHKKRAKSCKK